MPAVDFRRKVMERHNLMPLTMKRRIDEFNNESTAIDLQVYMYVSK